MKNTAQNAKNAKQPKNNYTPNKAKRRPDGWNPSPTKSIKSNQKKG